MDSIKLKSAEELHTRLTVEDHWDLFPSLIDCIDLVIKEAQRNAIEFTLQQASQNATADVNFIGWLNENLKTYNIQEGQDYEVYVINSSILNLKETIYKENNL